jgi:hypothetical protein
MINWYGHNGWLCNTFFGVEITREYWISLSYTIDMNAGWFPIGDIFAIFSLGGLFVRVFFFFPYIGGLFLNFDMISWILHEGMIGCSPLWIILNKPFFYSRMQISVEINNADVLFHVWENAWWSCASCWLHSCIRGLSILASSIKIHVAPFYFFLYWSQITSFCFDRWKEGYACPEKLEMG